MPRVADVPFIIANAISLCFAILMVCGGNKLGRLVYGETYTKVLPRLVVGFVRCISAYMLFANIFEIVKTLKHIKLNS